ncbi:zeta toxin family protein [Kitasatospora sp. NPDC002227]|uniref:zeta toxin family protein n=1 Tax=Kitasatospora sp. NPDC002227 TaxID=3154773 RepID=UPI0033289755
MSTGQVLLPAAESDRLFDEVIAPAFTTGAVPQAVPVVVLVAGQPGAGKSTAADLVQAALGARGGAVRIGSDLYKPFHPHYARLLAENPRTAGPLVRADIRRWQAAMEQLVRERRFDAVVETALACPQELRADADAYRRARYRVELLVVATAAAWSQLGLLDRYLGDGDGAVRFVSWDHHDACTAGLLRTLAVAESERLVDRVSVVRRGLGLLYSSEPAPGPKPAQGSRAAAVLTAEHRRWWDAAESARFQDQLAAAGLRMHTRPLTRAQRLAVDASPARAQALAEPVRRLAQPSPLPCGVDYHRLAPDHHAELFRRLVLPSLGPLQASSNAQPTAVFVIGQPGAGKTAAADTARAELPGSVRLSNETFKNAHPDYDALLRVNPRTAASTIRTDCGLWAEQAERLVRESGADAVLEVAPGNAASLLARAAAFHQAGYWVEFRVLAVRAADSRQGTALRYASALRLGIHARFTSSSGHDTCYRAVADTVAAAERHAAVDQLTVTGRDGGPLTADPVTGQGPTALLTAKRLRPYTSDEAQRFLTVQRALLAALPQHRAELEEITALGRCLMPGQADPGRSGRVLPALPRTGC